MAGGPPGEAGGAGVAFRPAIGPACRRHWLAGQEMPAGRGAIGKALARPRAAGVAIVEPIDVTTHE